MGDKTTDRCACDHISVCRQCNEKNMRHFARFLADRRGKQSPPRRPWWKFWGMSRAILPALLLFAPAAHAQTRELLWAQVNGQRQQVWGFRQADGSVLYHPHENPHIKPAVVPPPAPPTVEPAPQDGGAEGLHEAVADLPAYALNGVVEAEVPRERVIYTNVPSLAPKLAREYGVEVRTDGPPPTEYPEADGTRIFVGPAFVFAAGLLFWLRFRRPA